MCRAILPASRQFLPTRRERPCLTNVKGLRRAQLLDACAEDCCMAGNKQTRISETTLYVLYTLKIIKMRTRSFPIRVLGQLSRCIFSHKLLEASVALFI